MNGYKAVCGRSWTPPITGLLMLLFCNFATAQLSQPHRFETVHKTGSSDYTVISMNDRGLALIHQKDKYEAGRNFWEITLLDSALQQEWSTELMLSNQLRLIGYEYAEGAVYYLFRMGTMDSSPLHMIRVSEPAHLLTEFEIEPKLDFNLSYFSVIGKSALLGGTLSRQPTLFLYEFDTGRHKVVPGFVNKNTELLDLRTNRNATFNALLLDKSTADKKQLVVRTMDESGALILDDLIDVDQDKSILSGITSTLVRDEMLIAGTWGQLNGKVALGIYTAVVDPFNKQEIHYYSFSDFTHFLDYNPPKKAARIRARTSRRKKEGKLPSWGVYVNPARLAESPDGFMLLSEIYSPMSANSGSSWNYYNPGSSPYGYGYSPYGYNPYSYRNYPYSGSMRHSEVTVRYSSVAVFDANGKLREDTGMKLNDIKLPVMDQVSDFTFMPDKIIQVFRHENDLKLEQTPRDSTREVSRSTTPIQLASALDVLRHEDNDDGSLRFWYNNYFFVWGYETIREKGDIGSHKVFYVNKIEVD